ncbi:hypothetical protein BH20ACI2_BH20ACI2_12220 [soil metagenome]
MFSPFIKTIILSAFFLIGALQCHAQSAADNQSSVLGRPGESDKDDRPRTIRDTMQKMRIEKEKKDFQRMIERGEEVVKIAAELEQSLEQKGQLTGQEIAKLASVEKLAKQIRSDLGGGDDDGTDGIRSHDSGFNVIEAIRTLRSSTEDLFNELQKTTRFTISATAIQSSNAVLRLARFMRIAR